MKYFHTFIFLGLATGNFAMRAISDHDWHTANLSQFSPYGFCVIANNNTTQASQNKGKRTKIKKVYFFVAILENSVRFALSSEASDRTHNMNTPYTPTPWITNNDEYGNFIYALNDDGTNRFYFSITGGYVSQHGEDSKQWERTSREEIKANANLCIASADLYEALKYQERHSNGDASCDYQTFLHMRDAAIAKAEGKNQP